LKEKSSTKGNTSREPREKGDSERPGRPKPSRVPYILVGIAVFAHIFFFLPFHGVSSDIPEIGDISTEEVIAPFNYPILKSEEELAREKEIVRLNVPVILDYRGAVGDSALAEFDSLWETALLYIEDKRIPARADSVRKVFPWLLPEAATSLVEFRKVSNVRQNVRELLTEVFSTGVFNWESMVDGDTAHLFNVRKTKEENIEPSERIVSMESARERINERAIERFMDYPEKGKVVSELARGFVRANLLPDIEATGQNRQMAIDNIKPVRGIVLKDQRIVDAHERVTEETRQKLVSLAIAKSGRYSTTPAIFNILRVVGRLLLTLLVLVILSYIIEVYYKKIWADPAKYTVVLFAVWLPGLFAFIFRLAGWPELLTPMAFSAALLAVLFGTQLTIVVVLASALLVSISGDGSFGILTVLLIEGVVAAEVFSHVAQRRQSIKPIIYTVAAAVIAAALLDFVSYGEFGKMGVKSLSVAAGCIFGPLLAIALLPVFERIVGEVTDFTLLEYANTNAPVLQQLAIEAPGTYHHSIVVGNLAERAAEAIGANPLLAKVGALYHDIGKLIHPEYFSENLSDENPHDKLSPHMSFLVLSGHVKDGVRLARIHVLPEVIIDIIREHHGTSVMKFFYDQARSIDKSITEDAFRYPGPIPQSPESAIVMLADGIEARIRSMGNMDSNAVKRVIKDIIDDKFETGQLSETDLSTRDLKLISESFATIMEGVLHRRPSLVLSDEETLSIENIKKERDLQN